jgi:O-antigen/teichoic acid export membrane protein
VAEAVTEQIETVSDRCDVSETSLGSGRCSFGRHILLFSLANLVVLVCNGVLTFLLPRLLSMESYGYYRLFLFYGGFAGVLHLGLPDGALIRWAARPQQRLNAELVGSFTFLLAEHAAVLMPATAILALLFHRQPWFFLVTALALYAVVFNVAALGQFALQAEKMFGLLSLVTVLNPVLLLAAVVALHYSQHLTLGTLVAAFILSWTVAAVPVWGHLLGKFRPRTSGVRHAWRIGACNIRVGWSVLLALLCTNVALSLDRIAVSLSFGIRDFAIYSLAATALAVVNTIILSVARVVFPYLSDGLSAETQVRAYWWGEACLVGLWAISLTGYFPLHWLITWLLPNYVPSLPVLRLLMLGTGLTGIIHILQCNYFRSTFRLARMLLGCAAGLVSALALLTLARRTGELSMMALAMLGAIGLWWMLNEHLLKPLTGGNSWNMLRTALVYTGCALWFVFCTSWNNLLAGASAYLGVSAVLVFLSYRAIIRTVPRLRLFPLLGWSTEMPE